MAMPRTLHVASDATVATILARDAHLNRDDSTTASCLLLSLAGQRPEIDPSGNT